MLQGLGDGHLASADGLVLEAGSGGVQQEADRQRQHHRDDGHREQMQPDNPPQQRVQRTFHAASDSM